MSVKNYCTNCSHIWYERKGINGWVVRHSSCDECEIDIFSN
jgi:hypothetical protein